MPPSPPYSALCCKHTHRQAIETQQQPPPPRLHTCAQVGSLGQLFVMSNGINRGVLFLKANQFWDNLTSSLIPHDPDNCLLKAGPDSVRDLLQKILVPYPANSISVRAIADHPWLKGDVPTPEEMQAELRRRFPGILKGAPRRTAFFDLGPCPDCEGLELMDAVASAVCDASGGEFVKTTAGVRDPGFAWFASDALGWIRSEWMVLDGVGLSEVVLRCVVLCCVVLCCVVLCCVVLCCVVLCCVVLCCVVLCCVVLCWALLYCVVLCCAEGAVTRRQSLGCLPTGTAKREGCVS